MFGTLDAVGLGVDDHLGGTYVKGSPSAGFEGIAAVVSRAFTTAMRTSVLVRLVGANVVDDGRFDVLNAAAVTDDLCDFSIEKEDFVDVKNRFE